MFNAIYAKTMSLWIGSLVFDVSTASSLVANTDIGAQLKSAQPEKDTRCTDML